MAAPQNSKWCFTLNNYDDGDVEHLRALAQQGTTKYLVFGREVSPTTGTPHLQGYVIFSRSIRRSVAKQRLCRRDGIHVEPQRARDNQVASDYCKKDGDFEEFGEFQSTNQGHRSDWDRYVDYIKDLGRMPTQDEIIQHNPGLWARYGRRCHVIANAFLERPKLVPDDDEPRFGWQTRCAGLIEAEEAANRKIFFVVDEEGNSGKSWMCRWALTKFPDKVQVLRIGKRDDLAYTIDETKEVFLFDVPRSQMTFLQYSVLESLKDQMIFSPKYESSSKILRKRPQVIVFCNEEPDLTQLSRDRYEVIRVQVDG